MREIPISLGHPLGGQPKGGSPSKIVVRNMISRCQSESVTDAQRELLLDQFQVVPAIYNRSSNLYRTVEATPGKVYLNFKLSKVDPLVKAPK